MPRISLRTVVPFALTVLASACAEGLDLGETPKAECRGCPPGAAANEGGAVDGATSDEHDAGRGDATTDAVADGASRADAADGAASSDAGKDAQVPDADSGTDSGPVGGGAILPPGPWFEASAGIEGGSVRTIAYDPSTAGTAYAASWGAGVFKTTDGGLSWSASSQGLEDRLCVSQVLPHPAQPTTVFALASRCDRSGWFYSHDSAVVRSTDSGATWTNVTPPGVTLTDIDRVFATKANKDVVYLRAQTAVYRSLDGGTTFQVRAFPGGRFTTSAVADDARADVVYLTSDIQHTPAIAKLFRSTDGMASWSEQTIPNAPYVTSVWQSPADGTVFARASGADINAPSSRGNLWATRNGGSTWDDRFPPSTSTSQRWYGDLLAFAPSDAQRLYTFWSTSLVYSKDQGRTLVVLPDKGIYDPRGYVRAIAASPANADEVLFAANELQRSTSGLVAYAEATRGLTNRDVTALSVATSEPRVLYAGTPNRVFRTSNGGGSWARVGKGLPEVFQATALAVHPRDPEVVYAGLYVNESSNWVARVYKSIDGGATFQRLDPAPALPNRGALPRVDALYVDRADPARVLMLASDELLGSTNDGVTWSRVLPMGSTRAGTRVVPHPTATSEITLVPTDQGSRGDNVLRSVDGGLTFAPFPVPPTTVHLAFDVARSQVVYACTGSGPMLSTNGGISFSLATVGIVSVRGGSATCQRFFQTRADGRVYMLDHDGALWSSKDTASSWVRAKGVATPAGGIPLSTMGGAEAIQDGHVDPTAPDVVYLATRGFVGVVKTTTGGQ